MTVKELLDKILHMYYKHDPDMDMWKDPPMPKPDGGDYITDILEHRAEQDEQIAENFRAVIARIGSMEVK